MKMDTFELLNSVFALRQNFPDLDAELVLLAWTPRGSRIPDRTFDRLREKYGISGKNNKVLEFVGDSVLGIISLNQILEGYGLTLRPGQYHNIHRGFVSNENLTQIALGVGLPDRLFPGVPLNDGDNWHNPCSNSIEATLAAIYTQYSDLNRIRKWFFGIPEIWENYQSHIDKNISKLPKPVENFPEIEESEDSTDFQNTEDSQKIDDQSDNSQEADDLKPVEIPKKSEKRFSVPRFLGFPLPRIRYGNLSVSSLVEEGRFALSIKKPPGSEPYILSGPGYYPIYKGIVHNCESASHAMEVIMKRERFNENSSILVGKIPYYSEVYSSPGDGWYGYYKKAQGAIFIVSEAVPTQEEFEMAKDLLAMRALIMQGVQNMPPLDNVHQITLQMDNHYVKFSDVPHQMYMQLFPVGGKYSPPLLQIDARTKIMSRGTFEQAVQILKKWDLRGLTDYREETLINFSEKNFKFFGGKFNLYSKIFERDYYGYGVRFLLDGKVGEIPLSYFYQKFPGRTSPYLEFEENNKKTFCFNQALIYLRDRLGLPSNPSEIYSPWDLTKYQGF